MFSDISISDFIALCGLQTVGLFVILMQKKFRSAPNNILKLILLSLLVYYAFYYFYFSEHDLDRYVALFLSFATLSPLLIYFYCQTIIDGVYPKAKTVYPHFILPGLTFLGALYVLVMDNHELEFLTLKTYVFVLGIQQIIYPLLIINRLGKIYHLSSWNKLKVFSFNKEKTVMIKLFISMMLFHSLLLNTKSVLFIAEYENWFFLEILNIVFLLVLSYLIGYAIITMPTGVHTSNKKIAVSGYKKYDKSGLSKEKASEIASKLNELCREEKVFLDPNINLKTISSKIEASPHHVTETLNRLIGQSFSEYINNFRIEEFKILIAQEKYKNYSILGIAMEVGFNSKATFNAAFKKFTKQTPSQYKSDLLNINKSPQENKTS
jgi:AraC-like DNA-binding protein